MKRFRIALSAICLVVGLTCPAVAQTTSTTTSTTSSCPTCDCNNQASLCRVNCQGSGDFVGIQQCNIKCSRNYQTCLDQAYNATRLKQQKQQQQQQTATNRGGTAVGTSSTGGGS